MGKASDWVTEVTLMRAGVLQRAYETVCNASTMPAASCRRRELADMICLGDASSFWSCGGFTACFRSLQDVKQSMVDSLWACAADSRQIRARAAMMSVLELAIVAGLGGRQMGRCVVLWVW